MLNACCWNRILTLSLVAAITAGTSSGQLPFRTTPKPGEFDSTSPDTLVQRRSVPLPPSPVLPEPINKDTMQPRPQTDMPAGGGIDTLVVFIARDTMLFTTSERRLSLYGNARLSFRQQELTAEIIELWIDRAELSASGIPIEHSEHVSNAPVFRDGQQLYRGQRIRYNFHTRRGVVTGVSTQMGEGTYSGERLKQVEPGIFYVQMGCYTTCNAEHPHFRICAPYMKVISGDRVFANPVIIYAADVPIFLFPFGLFFPNRGGRQSGVLTPSFFFSTTGGLVLENLGYFYAPSDYWDVQMRATLRTRQGFVFHTSFRYAIRDWLRGTTELSGGWVRSDLDAPMQRQWNLVWNHRQRITPQWDIQANVQLGSLNYYRQVSTDLRQRLLDNIVSAVGSSYVFESGASLSLSLQREQNLTTGAHSGTLPQATLTLPPWTPLWQWYTAPEWLRQLTLDYSVAALWQYNRGADGGYTHRSYIAHSPSLRLSPRLGYFTVVPSINYGERWYFRQIRREMQPGDSLPKERRISGFYREYWYSLGIGLSTRLYGIAGLGGVAGLEAIRHLIQPTVNLSYTPAFPQFYSSYMDYRSGTLISYNRFALDGGGIAPRKALLRLDYRLLNSFEAKPLSRDTSSSPPVELFRLSLSGSYNALADSLRLSDVSLDFSIPALRFLALQGSATGTPYMETRAQLGNTSYWQRVNRFRLTEGLFPLRWTSVRLQAEMSFSGQLRFVEAPISPDTSALAKGNADWFGEHPTPLSSPPLQWSLRLGMAFRYEEPIRGQLSRGADLLLTSGFTLGSWQIQASGNIDLLNRQLVAPIISLRRDLHCWELHFEWYPLGSFRGYWLRFSPRASVLRELKYEEKTIPGL